MFLIATILVTFTSVTSILAFVAEQSTTNLMQFLYSIVLLLLYWGLSLCRFRFKAQMINLILILYVILQIMTGAFTIELPIDYGMVARMCAQFVLFTLLLAPTFRQVAFYQIVLYINIAQLVLRTDDDKVLLIIICLVTAVISTVLFYIFQRRELKRFV